MPTAFPIDIQPGDRPLPILHTDSESEILCFTADGQINDAEDVTVASTNASLFASEAGGLMTINGITQQGATLTLELDSLSVGTHAMTETNNTIL